MRIITQVYWEQIREYCVVLEPQREEVRMTIETTKHQTLPRHISLLPQAFPNLTKVVNHHNKCPLTFTKL